MTDAAGDDRPVLLALGDDGSVAAIRYAAEEAGRCGRALRLVLVVPPGRGGTHPGDQLELGYAVGLARDRAAAGTRVSGALVPGTDVVASLVEAAAGTDLLVLARTGTDRSGRLVGGSVLAVVAARSPAPVVVVPSGWRPRAHQDPVVVVGVQDAMEAPALLDTASAAAHDLGARLEVVHVQAAGGGSADLGPCLAAVRSRWPDLEVDLGVVRGHPEAVLLAATARADLVVAGRHHHRLPTGSHLGPVTRALLDRSAAPLLLTTPGTTGPGHGAPDPHGGRRPAG